MASIPFYEGIDAHGTVKYAHITIENHKSQNGRYGVTVTRRGRNGRRGVTVTRRGRNGSNEKKIVLFKRRMFTNAQSKLGEFGHRLQFTWNTDTEIVTDLVFLKKHLKRSWIL